MTDDMEKYFNPSSHGFDLQQLFDYYKQHGETVIVKKGERLECEGYPAQNFFLVEQGCFKFVTRSISDEREHILWFSFENEFVGDYPNVLYGRPARFTIVAMTPSRVLKISNEDLIRFFSQSTETMELRTHISEHLLNQFQNYYINIYRLTPYERYEMLLHRCRGIVNKIPLKAIASFLHITPKTLSMFRRDAVKGGGKKALSPPKILYLSKEMTLRHPLSVRCQFFLMLFFVFLQAIKQVYI